MVTTEQARLNLRTVVRIVRTRMGLPLDSDQFPYDVRNRYWKELAAEILKYPQSFTPEILQSAQFALTRDLGPLEDTSFQWGEFGDEVAANAPGVALKASSIALGVLSVVAVFYFALLAAKHRPRR